MQLTHFGHAAVLVETDSGRRALFDPGTYAEGFETLRDLDVILLTHAHPDHVDVERLGALRDANRDAVLVANPDAADFAGDTGDGDMLVVDDSSFEVAGVRIEPTGAVHGVIHPVLPEVANTGFILDARIWHPGDAFDAQPRPVDVLLLPVGGPWMKIAEAIDFARAVSPRVVVPIHQGGLADVHRQLHYGLLRRLVSSSEIVVLEPGVPQHV